VFAKTSGLFFFKIGPSPKACPTAGGALITIAGGATPGEKHNEFSSLAGLNKIFDGRWIILTNGHHKS